MCNQIIIIDMIISNVFVNFSIHIDTTIEGLILDAWQVPHISDRFSSTLTGLTYYYSKLCQVPLKVLVGSSLILQNALVIQVVVNSGIITVLKLILLDFED